MTVLNETLVNALKTASAKEITFLAHVIQRATKKGVSIYEAVKIEKYLSGMKVYFKDVNGRQRIGVVDKVLTKRVRVIDKENKRVMYVYPNNLTMYDKGDEMVSLKRKYNRKVIA